MPELPSAQVPRLGLFAHAAQSLFEPVPPVLLLPVPVVVERLWNHRPDTTHLHDVQALRGILHHQIRTGNMCDMCDMYV